LVYICVARRQCSPRVADSASIRGSSLESFWQSDILSAFTFCCPFPFRFFLVEFPELSCYVAFSNSTYGGFIWRLWFGIFVLQFAVYSVLELLVSFFVSLVFGEACLSGCVLGFSRGFFLVGA
jgi:hypothetical protein